MSNRGGSGGYAAHSGVQPNHQSQRNFAHGSTRAPVFNQQPRQMMTQPPTSMPQLASNANIMFPYQIHNVSPHIPAQAPVVRYPVAGQHQYTYVVPQYFPIHVQNAFAINNRNVSGAATNANYQYAAQGMNSADNIPYPSEPAQYHPQPPGPIHNTTPSAMHLPTPSPVSAPKPAPLTKQRTPAILMNPDTKEVLSEEYLKTPLSQETTKPTESSTSTTTSTTPYALSSMTDDSSQKAQEFMDKVTKAATSPLVSGDKSGKMQEIPPKKHALPTSTADLKVRIWLAQGISAEDSESESSELNQLSDFNNQKKVEKNTEEGDNQENQLDNPLKPSNDQKKELKASEKPSESSTSTEQSGKSSIALNEESAKTTQAPKRSNEQHNSSEAQLRVEADNLSPVTSDSVQKPLCKESNTNSSLSVSNNESKIVTSSDDQPQPSPKNKDIPVSHGVLSSPKSNDTQTGDDAKDVVDHTRVVDHQEDEASIPKDAATKPSESNGNEVITEKSSNIDNEEDDKENDKPATDQPKLNSKGKYEYKADFLKSLQNHPLSMKKPDLPDLDIVQQVPIPHREKQTRNMNNDFLPAYMVSGRNNRPQPPGRIINRVIRPPKVPIKIIPSPSLTQDVNLHTVENAWKPAIPALKPVDSVDEEEKKTVELVKRFRGILNKLTPQKYDDLIKQVDSLVIDTEDRLRAILELIFDKAVDEPAFCTDYAKLCKHISTLTINSSASDKKDENSEKDQKANEQQFRQLLLKRCQEEFESDIYKDIDIESRLEEIEKITDPEKKRIAILELDEDKRKARKRTLGIIKFIGELYMYDMLRVLIMDSCVKRLLQQKDDESLECLCTLLRTVGAKWEADNAKKKKNHIQICIDDLTKIVHERSTSSRVRFMIQDVLDMKRDGWKIRKIQAENKPKTIEQLHAEIQQEEQNKKHEIQQHIIKSGDTRKMPSKQDEWNSQRNNRANTPGGNQILDAFKILTTTSNLTSDFSLAPNRPSWGQGAGVGQGFQSQRSQNSDTIRGRNSSNERDKNARSSGNNMSRDASESRTTSLRPFSSSQKDDSYSGFPGRAGNRLPSTVAPFSSDSIKKGASSRSNSSEKSNVSDSRSNNNSAVRESPKKEVIQGIEYKGSSTLRDEQVIDKGQGCVQEYLKHKLKDDAKADVIHLCTDKNVSKYVEAALNVALESSHEIRNEVGELLLYLVKEKVIKMEHFRKGLNELLQFASEMILDIPHLWIYIAETLAPLFCGLDDSNRKNFFVKVLEPCKEDPEGKAALVMYHILNLNETNSKSSYDCGSAWMSGGFEWSAFLPSRVKSPEEFFQSQNPELPILNIVKRDSNQLPQKLQQMSEFAQKHNHDELIKYISEQFKPIETTEPQFVRALTRAVVAKCVTPTSSKNPTYKLNTEQFGSYCSILAKFSAGKNESESEILFTLQEMMLEYNNPKGLLMDLFDTLQRKQAVSDEAFIEWETSKKCPKNKDISVSLVKEFLFRVREGGNGSDS